MPEEWLAVWIRIGVAALGGLAVGIEREWSIVKGKHEPHFAGVRTFLLLGTLGALSALLAESGLWLAGAVLIIAAAMLTVFGYAMTSRKGDVGGTTEVAGLLVLAGGLFAGVGKLTLASGVFALLTLVLIEKGRLHRFVSGIQSEELLAAARFAVLALVVFPLLPEGPLGPPPGVRPQELWALVLIFSGLSFAGFLALRLIGARHGYYLVGLLGGLVSSTAVTLNFSRESRQQPPELGRALALGVIAACSVLPLRTLALTLLLNPAVGQQALGYLLPPAFAGLSVAWWLNLKRRPTWSGRPRTPSNPLRFIVAIQMVLAFQVVLYLVDWIQGRFGSSGLLGSAALLGLTDVDALIYSMVRLGGAQALPETAAKVLAIGVLSNTLFKCGIVLSLGRREFRGVAAAGLLTFGAAALAMLLLAR